MSAFLSHYRALGRRYDQAEHVLRSLREFLVVRGAADLDQRLFDQWRASFHHLSGKSRYSYETVVYHLYRYRRRAEPSCFLPDPSAFSRPQPAPLPSLIESQQIAKMLELAWALPATPASPLRPAVMRLALVLLYTAGLRRGELLRLTLADADAQTGVLHIRASKFHKSRWVPLSASARAELRRYLELRRSHWRGTQPSAPLLCVRSRGWRPYSGSGISDGLHALFAAADVRTPEGRLPRIQDLRHSFAVAALLRWYRAHADVQANLPKLALYMGHVSIVSTAYYLRWMPAVMACASERFERGYGRLVQDGAS
jgi:integrase